MTNNERLEKVMTTKGLVTEDQLAMFKEEYGIAPANTIRGWNKLGFSVKKGEKVAAWTRLWEKKGDEFELTFAGLFRIDQVQPTHADYSTKQKKMLKMLGLK